MNSMDKISWERLFAVSYNTESDEKSSGIILCLNLTKYVAPLLVLRPTVNAVMEEKLESFF